MFEIEERSVPEATVLTIQRNVLVDSLPTFVGEAMGNLLDRVSAKGEVFGAPFVIYHGEVNKDSDGPVEVCVPFIGNVAGSSDVQVRIEPAHQEAYTRITKGQVEFPRILDAYEAVHKYIADRGYEPAGSPREVYFADWDSVGPSDPACDIAWPVGATG